MAIVVCAILAFLICLLCCLYYKQRERKNTERKDSWDISTMFTNTSASWADEAPADASPQQSQEPATPQELNKITEAAEL